ncbi:hypothetical protein BDR07DRAFT_1385530 [Suillus spraguei]|nr:hypothetical protein BDR07DRAFT_1385530 [Suillus spraguei]
MPDDGPPQQNIQGCSLTMFNNQCIALLDADEDNAPIDPAVYYRAINLVLTGKDSTTGIQYSIEPTRNRFTQDREIAVPEVPVFPYRVPNICLGIINVRTKLRMFFPALYEEEGSAKLTLEQKTTIYEDGLLPTLELLNPETLTNWPTSYASALIHVKKRNNLYQYGTHPFPESMVPRLGI